MLDWKIPDDDQLSMVLAAWGFLKLNDSAEAEKLLNKVNAAGGLATNALPAELKSLPEEIKKSLEQPSKDATLKKIILMTTNTIS